MCSPRSGTGPAGPAGTSEKLTGPRTDRWAGTAGTLGDVDQATGGQELGVFDHLGRCLGRGPPDALGLEALGPLVEGPGGDDLVEHGDHLRPVLPDGLGVGEAGVLEQFGAGRGRGTRRGGDGRSPSR